MADKQKNLVKTAIEIVYLGRRHVGGCYMTFSKEQPSQFSSTVGRNLCFFNGHQMNGWLGGPSV